MHPILSPWSVTPNESSPWTKSDTMNREANKAFIDFYKVLATEKYMFKSNKTIMLLLSSTLSLFLLTGCATVVDQNGLTSSVVQGENTITYNTLSFVVNNHYGDSISDLKIHPDSSFEFLLKDRIHVTSSAFKNNSWNYVITLPNDPSLYPDLGNTALLLTGGNSSEQAISCQQSLIKSLPHISNMRTTFYASPKGSVIPITGDFWLEGDKVHITYIFSVPSSFK